MRTDGMSLQEAVRDILRSSTNRERGLKHSVVLEQYAGPAAIQEGSSHPSQERTRCTTKLTLDQL